MLLRAFQADFAALVARDATENGSGAAGLLGTKKNSIGKRSRKRLIQQPHGAPKRSRDNKRVEH